MPIGYITQPHAIVRRRGETLLVIANGETVAQWPCLHLNALVLMGAVHVTRAAFGLLARKGIDTSFLTRSGRLLYRLTPSAPASVTLRLAQYRLTQRFDHRLELSRRLVDEKLAAQIDLLDRYASNYPDLNLGELKRGISRDRSAVAKAGSLATLRGIEGSATQLYWTAFRLMNRSDMEFDGRSRRPPRDPVNALLSFGYGLLSTELLSQLEALGADPYLGFYHTVNPRRASLTLDLMEPFRHWIVDRLVLRLVNLRRFQPDDFRVTADGGYLLQGAALPQFFREYDQVLRSPPDSHWKASDRQATVQSWREALLCHCQAFARAIDPRGFAARQPQVEKELPHA